MVKYRAVAVAVAVAVSGGGAVAVAVAGLTKRFFNHIQKDFLINVWGYERNDDDDNDGDDDDDMEPYKITCRKTQVQLAAGTVSVRGEHSGIILIFPSNWWTGRLGRFQETPARPLN